MKRTLIKKGEIFQYVNDVFKVIPVYRQTGQSTWGKAKNINVNNPNSLFVCVGKGNSIRTVFHNGGLATELRLPNVHHFNDWIENNETIIEGVKEKDNSWPHNRKGGNEIDEIRAYFTTIAGSRPYIFRGVFKISGVNNYQGYEHKVRIWKLVANDLVIDDEINNIVL